MFDNDTFTEINAVIEGLEHGAKMQMDLNIAYSSLCDITESEMF